MKTRDITDHPSVVLFYTVPHVAVNDARIATQIGLGQFIDDPLLEILRASPIGDAGYFKLGYGVFLIDEDQGYPAILEMMNHCHQKKVPFLISKLSDFPLSIPPFGQGWQEWLQNKQVKYRLTRFASPQAVPVRE